MIPYISPVVNVQPCRCGCTVSPLKVFNFSGATVQFLRSYCSVSNGQGVQLGRYIQMRLDYLKKHRRGTYTTLLTSCTLNQHLYDTEQEAKRHIDLILSRLVKERGITEELKVCNPLRWVQEMNNTKNCTEEIVLNEIIYK